MADRVSDHTPQSELAHRGGEQLSGRLDRLEVGVKRGVMADQVHTAPMRTCVGCRERDAQSQLVRAVRSLAPQSGKTSLRLDHEGTAPGRGAWIHPASPCIDSALKRGGFARSFREPVDPDAFVAELRARVNPS